MGRDLHVLFDVDAPLLMVRDPRDADPEDGREPERWAAERLNRFVALLDERSTMREGDPIELAVDTARAHVFDPADGRAIGD